MQEDMLQTAPFENYTDEYEAWYEKYPAVYQSELNAIRSQFAFLPQNIQGIQVGMGTGRFATPLGIREGIEPVAAMRELAVKRGIEAMDARAESLPYGDLHFDFVLFVTICHLDNVHAAFAEAWRVLKRDGTIVVAFLDKSQPVAKSYEEKRQRSRFYKHARFYSVDEVAKRLKEAGFKDLHYVQCLFKPLDEIDIPEAPRDGFGEGSFVVVRATKKMK